MALKMLLANSEYLFIVLAAITLMGAQSCEKSLPQGLNVKVYLSIPEQGGLVRSQDNEVIKYEHSQGYLCLSEPDTEALLNYCNSKNQAK